MSQPLAIMVFRTTFALKFNSWQSIGIGRGVVVLVVTGDAGCSIDSPSTLDIGSEQNPPLFFPNSTNWPAGISPSSIWNDIEMV